jgi:hypothetical protein
MSSARPSTALGTTLGLSKGRGSFLDGARDDPEPVEVSGLGGWDGPEFVEGSGLDARESGLENRGSAFDRARGGPELVEKAGSMGLDSWDAENARVPSPEPRAPISQGFTSPAPRRKSGGRVGSSAPTKSAARVRGHAAASPLEDSGQSTPAGSHRRWSPAHADR